MADVLRHSARSPRPCGEVASVIGFLATARSASVTGSQTRASRFRGQVWQHRLSLCRSDLRAEYVLKLTGTHGLPRSGEDAMRTVNLPPASFVSVRIAIVSRRSRQSRRDNLCPQIVRKAFQNVPKRPTDATDPLTTFLQVRSTFRPFPRTSETPNFCSASTSEAPASHDCVTRRQDSSSGRCAYAVRCSSAVALGVTLGGCDCATAGTTTRTHPSLT